MLVACTHVYTVRRSLRQTATAVQHPPASLPLPAASCVPLSCARAASLLPTSGTLSSSVEITASAGCCGITGALSLATGLEPAAVCCSPGTPCSCRPCAQLLTPSLLCVPSSPDCTLHCWPCLTAAASLGDTLGQGTLSAAALRLRPAAASWRSSASATAEVSAAAALGCWAANAAASASASGTCASAEACTAPPTRRALDLNPAVHTGRK